MNEQALSSFPPLPTASLASTSSRTLSCEDLSKFHSFFTYLQLKEDLPDILEQTIAHCKSEKVSAQNQDWYQNA